MLNNFETNKRSESLQPTQRLVLCLFALSFLLFACGFWIKSWLGAGAIMLTLASAASLVRQGLEFPIEKIFNRKVFYTIFFFSFLCALGILITHYYSIEFATFDTGIFANVTYRFFVEHKYYNSVMQMPGLRDHFSPALMLLAPLYALWHSFLLLPLLKTLAFFACPVVLLVFSKSVLGAQNPLRYLLPILWMLHILMMKALTMEFQPSTLALPIILLTFYFAWNSKWWQTTICALLLLIFKENMAIVWLSLGMFILTEQRKKLLGFVFVAGGLGIGLFTFLWLIPNVTGGSSPHMGRFGPFDLLPEKVSLLSLCFASFALLPLAAPRTLLFILPAFALTLVAKDPVMVSWGFHYLDVPLTVMFVGSLIGLKELFNFKIIQTLSYTQKSWLVLGITLLLFMGHNNLLSRQIVKTWPSTQEVALIKELEKAKQVIPAETNLWTLNSIGPYFFDHLNLRCITENDTRLEALSNKTLLLPKSAPLWPLTEEQFAQMRQDAEALEKSGKLKRLGYYANFDLWTEIK